MDKTLKTIPKTSVRIWVPLLKAFDDAIENSCLRRDAYLNRLIELEVEHLDREVAVPNSEAAFAYVSSLQERIPRKLVSLALKPELTARVNAVCRTKRIVRDAFFNRLFLLLAVPELFDQLYFGAQGDRWDVPWRDDVMAENKSLFSERALYPLLAPVDPFCAIRLGLDIYWREAVAEDSHIDEHGIAWLSDLDGLYGGEHRVLAPNVYTRVFSGDINLREGAGAPLAFMNCHMPDHHVPSTAEGAQYAESLRDMAKRAQDFNRVD